MKKYILFISIVFLPILNLMSQDFVIADFEGSKTTYTVTSGGGAAAGASGIVKDDPKGGNGKALRLQIPNAAYVEFEISLPEGKKLSDYSGISMDIFIVDKGDGNNVQLYLGTWAEGSAPGRWSDGGTLKYNKGRAGDIGSHEWKTVVVLFSDCDYGSGITTADYNLNEFKILFGFGSNRTRYFMDNVKFIE